MHTDSFIVIYGKWSSARVLKCSLVVPRLTIWMGSLGRILWGFGDLGLISWLICIIARVHDTQPGYGHI